MFRKLALFSAVFALIVIVTGAYVRLSDAGLGCPDWPGCYGQAIPGFEESLQTDAKSQFSDHVYDASKAWKAMVHRYAAGLLGILIVLLSLTAWRVKHAKAVSIAGSLLLLTLIVVQAALGVWVVELKLMPIVVTTHLLAGLITFWGLLGLYWRTAPEFVDVTKANSGIRVLTAAAMLLLMAQIFLGGWVSTNLAALACTDFPRCNGQWLPDADYVSAIDFLRGFETGYKGVLAYDAQVAVHWLHRAGAVIVFVVLSVVMMVATSARYPKPIRKAGNLLSFLLLVQITLGVLSVRWTLPLPVALSHNAVAAMLMLPLVFIRIYARFALPETVVETLSQSEIPAALSSKEAEAEIAEERYVAPEPESLYLRLKTQLHKTRSGLGHVLTSLPVGQKAIDQDLLDEIEAQLLMADVGIEATNQIIQHLTQNLERHQLNDSETLITALKQDLYDMLQPCSQPLEIPVQDGPFVILVVGVNGAGKTTSIGKLAKRLQVKGHSVMLAAGDTFRAAAVEQLQTWGERNDIQVVAQHTGADSASVIYDALQSAQAKGIDVLIADTAGRLHTKSNLMDELFKIKRIMAKLDQQAPHEVLLVLDAGTGQNALSQAKLFNDAVNLTGIALTKLDGTAKGGVIFALAKQLGVPIRFIGIGEGIDDLQDFDAKNFVDALFVQD